MVGLASCYLDQGSHNLQFGFLVLAATIAYWSLFNIATIILRPDKYNNLNITWLFGPFQNRHLLFYLDVISIMDHLAIVHFKPFENLTCLNLPKFSLKFKTFLFLDWRICPRLVPYGNRCSGHGRLQEKYSHLETRYSGDVNSELVQYSNCWKQFVRQMVPFLSIYKMV